jgi:hypothetical protein
MANVISPGATRQDSVADRPGARRILFDVAACQGPGPVIVPLWFRDPDSCIRRGALRGQGDSRSKSATARRCNEMIEPLTGIFHLSREFEARCPLPAADVRVFETRHQYGPALGGDLLSNLFAAFCVTVIEPDFAAIGFLRLRLSPQAHPKASRSMPACRAGAPARATPCA